ncbi:MAG TPA: GvpL/GvpF family gas vesicle protein [Streptomyces sp.]|nr:GvpL/GvpF family gas vesicle protein [Streptomyces sp.]
MSGELVYAYAVVRAAAVPDDLLEGLRGVAGAPVHVLCDTGPGNTGAAGTGLGALVSPVPAADFDEAPLRARLEDLPWLERTARAHQRVVDTVASAACVLPMRLATVYRGEAKVRAVLAGDRERFGSALGALDGRIEWGVKVYADLSGSPGGEDSPERAAPAAAGRTAASGRDYLRQRGAARRARDERLRRAEEMTGRVHGALSELAERACLHRPQDSRLSGREGENLLNAAYLVPRERASEFALRVDELAERSAGLRVELTGPWAPYSFAGEAV